MPLPLANLTAPPLWRQIQRKNLTNVVTLADFLQLNTTQRQQLLERPRFPLNLPLRLAEKIAKGTLDDPILRQFLPLQEELHSAPNFNTDPVGDCSARQAPRLLHKYHGRALLVTTSACAMHCRYCFRQHFPYETTPAPFDEEIAHIRNDPTITEVILSGGDPLSLSNSNLTNLLLPLSQIAHVQKIRFHSRFPIGIPERIDTTFLNILKALPQQIWFVIHTNHPNELDSDIFAHLSLLQKQGIVVMNQAVLLRTINDSVETLHALCETLTNHGILPYYLHQLDRVQGASHFEVTEKEGLALIEQLRARLPGYAVPTYVRETAGSPNKTLI